MLLVRCALRVVPLQPIKILPSPLPAHAVRDQRSPLQLVNYFPAPSVNLPVPDVTRVLTDLVTGASASVRLELTPRVTAKLFGFVPVYGELSLPVIASARGPYAGWTFWGFNFGGCTGLTASVNVEAAAKVGMGEIVIDFPWPIPDFRISGRELARFGISSWSPLRSTCFSAATGGSVDPSPIPATPPETPTPFPTESSTRTPWPTESRTRSKTGTSSRTGTPSATPSRSGTPAVTPSFTPRPTDYEFVNGCGHGGKCNKSPSRTVNPNEPSRTKKPRM